MDNMYAHQRRTWGEEIAPLDAISAREAELRLDALTKPKGSLGRLENLAIQLCAIAGSCPPPLPEPVVIAVFAGDHGVVASGVTPWPSEVTAQMVANFCAGGAAINVLGRQIDAEVVVVDVGVAHDVPGPASSLLRRNVARGTANLAFGPAMTPDEVEAALNVGADIARDAVDRGARLLVTGEMGIGNTTPSAALIASVTNCDVRSVVGRGTGIDDQMLDVKTSVIATALERVASTSTPLDLLAEVGGLEIAALVGFILEAARERIPVVIDGVISVAAAVVADAIAGGVRSYLIAGHRSSEPGATIGLEHLGLEPLLDLSLRLGEGSGAALAVPLVQAAAKIITEMATFDSAGVSERDAGS